MTLDDLIEELNSFGRFQILLTIMVYTSKLAFAWSMVLPSFAGVTPDWWCIPSGTDLNQTVKEDNTTYKLCALANVSACTKVYSDEMITAVSEWDLVCDKRVISMTIASIQMAGVLIGVVLTGQIADSFGRKKIMFVSLGLHTTANLICAFSVSWQMYAVFRFLIGLSYGGFVGTYFPHLIEFIGCKWRRIIIAFPIWSIGVACFALFSYLCPNWRYLHIAAASLTAPYLLGYIFVPESLRWLAVKGRVHEAEAVVDKIVKYNKRPKPADTRARLEQVAQEELAHQKTHKKYTYLDVFRGWNMLKTTFCSSFIWFSCSAMYYGMTFGVSGLSGNLYLNIFLLTVVEIPGYLSTYCLLNRFGRKWTLFGFLLISGLAMVATLVVSICVKETYKGTLVNILALVGKFGMGTGYMVVFLFTNEIYPTVIRSLGYGVSQTAARIGGIVAPMMLLMDEDNIIVPYVLMGVMMLVSCLCLLFLPETKDRPLPDLLYTNAQELVMGKPPSRDIPGKNGKGPEDMPMLETSKMRE